MFHFQVERLHKNLLFELNHKSTYVMIWVVVLLKMQISNHGYTVGNEDIIKDKRLKKTKSEKNLLRFIVEITLIT